METLLMQGAEVSCYVIMAPCIYMHRYVYNKTPRGIREHSIDPATGGYHRNSSNAKRVGVDNKSWER